MKNIALGLLFALSFAFSAQAQCEGCSPLPAGEADFCFQDPSFSGYCITFIKGNSAFMMENQNQKSKKLKIRMFNIPSGNYNLTNYLVGLASDKAQKLNGAEVLFLERALQHKKTLEDIKLWNAAACNDGFSITETGLAYKVIEKANGTKPEAGDKVRVHYTGYLTNGRKFDSSYDRNQPFEFTLAKGMVIKGWDEGLQLMNVGSRYLFRIPAELAYGNRAVGNIIPPNATLYFDVVLLGVE